MTGGTNDPRKPEERAEEDWRGKESRPLSPWPPSPVHTGACLTRGTRFPRYTHTYTRTHTHHAFAHVGLATTPREKGPQELHEVWERRLGPPPGARCPPRPLRAHAHTRGSARLLQLRESPSPAPRSGVGRRTRWGPRRAGESRWPRWGPADAKDDVGVLRDAGWILSREESM